MIKAISAFFVSFGILGWVATFILWVLMVIGWLMNAYNVVMLAMNFSNYVGVAVDAAFVLKLVLQIVGIFYAPIGGIAGWVF